MRPKIEFEFDQPVAMHLRYAQGMAFDCPFDPRNVSYVFTAEEGRFYLSDTAGGLLNARLESRGIEAGILITITKIRVPNPNSARPVTEYIPEIIERLK